MKLGTIVCIEFLDHVKSNGDGVPPILCRVYGEVVKDEPTYYTVATWITDNDYLSHDNETFSILKSTVKRVRRLK